MDVIGAAPELMADRRFPCSARELLEWTYAEQMAHHGSWTGPKAAGISQTGLVIERMRLGCSIDGGRGGGAGFVAMACDHDALTVHRAVEGLDRQERELVIRHASLRSAPEWAPKIMPLRIVPMPGRKGKPKGIYIHSGKTLVGHEIAYEGDWPTRRIAEAQRRAWADTAPLDRPRLRCAEDMIEHARAAYRAWYDALMRLAARLGSSDWLRLIRWRVADIGAEAEPWAS